MKRTSFLLASIIATAFLAGGALAQNTFLTEDFQGGVMPPAGWTEGNNGNSLGWEIEPAGIGVLAASDHALHDDFFGWNDNYLMTPAMDLSAATAAYAWCDQGVTFSAWRDHHYVDVSLDGGLTFINVLDDLSPDGYSVLNVDLGAYVGNASVNVSYHYTGDYASEWELDNVVVDDVGPPPPPPAWPNLPAAFVAASGYLDDFESYAGVVPPHMAVNELDAMFGAPDPEAWCNIGQHAPAITASSGLYCLEMGLDPASNNYHDVRNGLILGLDGTGAGALELDFQAIDHGEETDPWDGVWLSDNGLDWFQAYGPWTSLSSSWQAVSVGDITGTGASTAGNFYLLFAQDDNFPYGYLDGIGVDDIDIHPPAPAGPVLSIANLVGGATATATVTNATPGGFVVFGVSATGGGPTSTTWGDVMLSAPIHTRWNKADAGGTATWNHQVYPHLSGSTLWFHALDYTTGQLSNALSEVVG